MKGKTIPCTQCKNILIRACEFTGQGTFQMLCPHCKELVTVKIGQDLWIKVAKATGVIAVLIIALALYTHTRQPKMASSIQCNSMVLDDNFYRE